MSKDYVPNPDTQRNAVREILNMIGEDPDREGLRETPDRVIKAWMAMTEGYRMKPADVLKVFEDGAENYDQLITMTNIPVYSHCEHHMIPFFGEAHIGYLPNKRIVGLSKLSRITDVFAKRLQVQERLTTQIAEALNENLRPRGVAVVLECRHMCMECRGVERVGATTVTSALRGLLLEDASAKREFFELISPARRK